MNQSLCEQQNTEMSDRKESEAFIRLENVSFYYPDEEEKKVHPALTDISFSVRRGEYVAVLGHNGSGKSTLAKLLNLILLPTSGKLVIDGKTIEGKNVSDEDIFDIRRKVGMVFQNPDNQLVATVVEEDVAFGPENLGIPREEIRHRVDDALETVGMTEYAKHATHKLSGGQKQRVAIAGVIAMLPQCIIFDESTAMLDPRGRRDVMQAIGRLNKEKNLTVLHITHYMEEAALADRILVINDSRLLLDGTPREIFSKVEQLREIGLEPPQSAALLYELSKEGYDVPFGCISADECASVLQALLKKENSLS